MLTLTENARTTVQDLAEVAGLPETGGLRIAPAAALEEGFELMLVPEAAPGDVVVDAGRTNVFLDPAAHEALVDQELDADPTTPETSFTVVPRA